MDLPGITLSKTNCTFQLTTWLDQGSVNKNISWKLGLGASYDNRSLDLVVDSADKFDPTDDGILGKQISLGIFPELNYALGRFEMTGGAYLPLVSAVAPKYPNGTIGKFKSPVPLFLTFPGQPLFSLYTGTQLFLSTNYKVSEQFKFGIFGSVGVRENNPFQAGVRVSFSP